jgi:hypothetical protein
MNDHDEVQAAVDVHTVTGMADRTDGVRNGHPSGAADEAVAAEEAYEPVPPRRTITFRVRCRLLGRGQPLPFPADDA